MERIIKLESKVNQIDEKVGRIAEAVHALQNNLAEFQHEACIQFERIEGRFAGLTKDINWIKLILSFGIAAMVSVGIYFAARQNTLSDQITELIKSLAGN